MCTYYICSLIDNFLFCLFYVRPFQKILPQMLIKEDVLNFFVLYHFTFTLTLSSHASLNHEFPINSSCLREINELFLEMLLVKTLFCLKKEINLKTKNQFLNFSGRLFCFSRTEKVEVKHKYNTITLTSMSKLLVGGGLQKHQEVYQTLTQWLDQIVIKNYVRLDLIVNGLFTFM